MKYVVVAVACFVFWGFQSSNQKNVVHPDNPKNQQQGSKSGLPAQSTIAPQSADKDSSDSRRKNEKTQDQKVSLVSVPEIGIEQRKDKFDWIILVCTIVLTIVGIAGTCLALRTLRAIQAQVRAAFIELRHTSQLAKAANKTAEAANMNASALINSERAWMMIDIKWHGNWTRFVKVNGGTGVRTDIDIDLVCTNEGSTPAWIIEKRIRLEVTNSLAWEPALNHPDTQFIEGYEPVGIRQNSKNPQWRINGEGWNERFCHVYGVVRYLDVFSKPQKPRETWFGFQIHSDGGIGRITSYEYNHHT